jgi:hypothetical protein
MMACLVLGSVYVKPNNKMGMASKSVLYFCFIQTGQLSMQLVMNPFAFIDILLLAFLLW